MRKELVLVPTAGLANRMRAVASAAMVARSAGVPVRVVWFRDKMLNARFDDLFQPVDEPGLHIADARGTDFLLNRCPRRSNLWWPWLPQRVCYDRTMYDDRTFREAYAGFDFEAWMRRGRSYLASYKDITPVPPTRYAQLFRPNERVEAHIDRLTQGFTPHTIGLHIRRSDHQVAISRSPLELFTEAVDREIGLHADTKVFLATDSEDVKQALKQRYPDRLLTAVAKASRDSVDGIIGGVADMWALARTSKIYGSAQSTFSVMASNLGACPLEVLERQPETTTTKG